MSLAQYELVFYGELAVGANPQQVRQNVAELFKASVEQVERMFSGQRVVIRNKLDADTAQKYVQAMHKRGAVCKIEAMGGATPTPAPSSAAGIMSAQGAPERSSSVGERSAATPPPATRPAQPRKLAPGQLPIAGEKVEEILAGKELDIAPVGVRLSEEKEVEAPVFEHLDEIKLAPLGSNMQEEKEEIPVSVPDISHIKLQ